MSNNNPFSSPTLRFLKQPESDSRQTRIPDPLELHESDVVWSFAAVAPADRTPSAPSHHHHHRRTFSPARSGLSAALSDDHHHLIRRKSNLNQEIIPMEARQDDAAERFGFPQSAPVKIPAWPRAKLTSEDLIGFDEVEDVDEVEGGEEMVPPHVIVARSHVTFSVFEGAGRTLKGRDLRRVRNAVFQKTVNCKSSFWQELASESTGPNQQVERNGYSFFDLAEKGEESLVLYILMGKKVNVGALTRTCTKSSFTNTHSEVQIQRVKKAK